jgi:hypothetical protein
MSDYTYNKEETDKLMAAVEGSPKTFGIVKENERIVTKHELSMNLLSLARVI